MKKLSGSGQIKKGATVVLAFRGEGQVHTVDQILNADTDKEEVLLDTKANLYFITSMAVDGTSWANDVKYANPTDNTVEMWGLYNFNTLVDVTRLRKVAVRMAENNSGEPWKKCKKYYQVRKVNVVGRFINYR